MTRPGEPIHRAQAVKHVEAALKKIASRISLSGHVPGNASCPPILRQAVALNSAPRRSEYSKSLKTANAPTRCVHQIPRLRPQYPPPPPNNSTNTTIIRISSMTSLQVSKTNALVRHRSLYKIAHQAAIDRGQ